MSRLASDLAPLLRQAVDHHRQGRLHEAEQGYRAVLRSAPNHADALHLLGVLAYQAEHLGPAGELIRRAIAANPRQGEYHSNLGNVLKSQGQFEAAAEAYRQAIALKPDSAIARNNLGVVLQALAQPGAAVESLRGAIALQPNYAEAYNNLAVALQDQGDDEAALVAYRRALELAPDYAEAHSNLGYLLHQRGQLDAADASLRRALDVKPDYPDALSNQGNLLLDLKRPDEAHANFLRSLELKPDCPDTYNNLGIALRRLSRREEALAAFQRALALRPSFAEAQNNLAWMLQAMGRPEEALPAHRRALGIDAGLAGAHHGVGNALRALGDKAAARAAYEQAEACAPAKADLLVDLASVVFDDHGTGPAAEVLERALAADPGHARANFLLGALRELEGDEAAAEACFARLPSGPEGEHHLLDSWRHVRRYRGPQTRFFGVSFDLLGHALDAASLAGLVLEFGVLHGTSLRFIASRTDRPLEGFDTFQGLPEAWGGNPAGAYSTQGQLPAVPDHVALHVGEFGETLPGFLSRNSENLRFAHIDCDLYSSTKTLLGLLAKRVVPDTVLVFDEYFCTPRWREDEYRAFQEAVRENGWRYDYLAFNLFTRQASVILKAS